MKKTITAIQNTFLMCVLFISIGFAQTPPAGLSGQALRDWFKANYYTGKHSQLGYNQARAKMYNYIDNKNNLITCVYGGMTVSWTYGGTGTNPAPINCEHTIPQSFFSEAEPMKSDIHHLFPTYGSWNTTRSNNPFKDLNDSQTVKWMIGTTSQTTIPTSNINAYSEYYNSAFEPREDHKGNVARAIFYFYNMYPTQAGPMSQVGDINLFYQWHLADPVDANEIARNEAVAQYQGNKNPYIVFPELVDEAWGLSGGTTPPVTTPGTNYCVSKGSSVADEWIASVIIGSFTKTSGANAGYADFTSSIVTLAQGSSNAVTLTPGYSGSQYPEYFKIWIDFNKDKDFADAGELVFDGGSAANGVKTGTLAIAANAATGATRMRVSMKYNGAQSYCEAFDYGEVEDYTVNITSGGTPNPTPTYCVSKGNSVADEWINQVTIGSINNTSAANAGYKDYTNLSTNLSKGAVTTITIYPGWSGSAYSEGYAVWIDYNKDGDFSDSGELVYSKAASTGTSASSSFTVPASATSGTTRMRVSMKYNGIPTECESFNYGEVEDYNINIIAGAREEFYGIYKSENEVEIFPNPATTSATVKVNLDENVVASLRNSQGIVKTTLTINGLSEGIFDLSTFDAGIYIINIQGDTYKKISKIIITK